MYVYKERESKYDKMLTTGIQVFIILLDFPDIKIFKMKCWGNQSKAERKSVLYQDIVLTAENSFYKIHYYK